ncbi:WxL domain-containing protein [Carnobacterium maltaromaticum]|uniref:WxL domain-containing protein n=1 Tax=Carnobacterium maltaromaticum TaxID=2751 RepID=UPI00295E395C|nr:WxL domain-containing protein [Carnobacterium maltaromaticum]
MKMTKLSSAAILIALVLGGTSIANADAKTKEMSGVIEFGEDDGSNPIVDPEKPTIPIPVDEIDENLDTGPLMIDGVTKLDFMKQKAVTTDQSYFAKQYTIKNESGSVVGTRGNFVQLTDKRIENRSPWTLKAKMTQQFTIETPHVIRKLEGSRLTFTNTVINSANTNKATWPTLGAEASSFVLTESGNSVNVMGTDDSDDGFGTYSVAFGSSAGVNGPTDTTGTPNATDANLIENGSVSLFVPGNIKKEKSDSEGYKAKVLWTLEEAP